jgi:hypothetical protein
VERYIIHVNDGYLYGNNIMNQESFYQGYGGTGLVGGEMENMV